MTQVTLPYRPIPGDPEDISQVMADFDSILNVLNSDIRNDNIAAAAAILISKLAGGNPGDYIEMVAGVPTWQKTVKASAQRTAAQSIPHAAHTAVIWTTEDFDTDNMVDVAGGTPSRFTAKTAGQFLFQFQTGWVAQSAGVRLMYLKRSDGATFGAQEAFPVAAPDFGNQATSWIIDLNVNDYVEGIVYQTSSGGALNTNGCKMTARRLGA